MFKTHFYGQEISNYGRETGYVDYHAFASAFNAVLNNEIISKTADLCYWENENYPDNTEKIEELENMDEPEVFQWYIVSDSGAELIQRYTDDPLYYSEELDMYVWGVTHWGTAWEYVLTDIPCEKEGK